MGFTEREVIAMLAKVFATHDERLLIGIGDDGAVVSGSQQQILTTDIAVEGIHFKTQWSSPYEIGARVAKANIADVLSMNGSCDYLLVAASLTGDETLEWVGELARGISEAASAAGAIVVGGDISRSPSLQITITAIGHSAHPVARAGARVGDFIYLSSLTGWAAAGLHILSNNLIAQSDEAKLAISEFKNPTLDARLDFSTAHAMADVSDSIFVQGAQIADASGVELVINTSQIMATDEFISLQKLAQELSADPWQWILGGGEDHVLLATGSNLPGICIGEVREGSGLSIEGAATGEIKMAPVSWSHFNKE